MLRQVGRKAPIALDEFDFLKKSTSRAGKITLPAPSTMHSTASPSGAIQRLPDAEQFFAELGKVYQAEIADLAAAGCRYVQLERSPSRSCAIRRRAGR